MIHVAETETPTARLWRAGSCDQKRQEGSVCDHPAMLLSGCVRRSSIAGVRPCVMGSQQQKSPVRSMGPVRYAVSLGTVP